MYFFEKFTRMNQMLLCSVDMDDKSFQNISFHNMAIEFNNSYIF